MFAKLCAKRNKKGFTLAELLIVVAIIAVLVAIAIPTYAAQLEKARVAVDTANARAGCSLAVADYGFSTPAKTGNVTYAVFVDDGNLTVSESGTAMMGQSSSYKSTGLTVTVNDNEVVSCTWGALIGVTVTT